MGSDAIANPRLSAFPRDPAKKKKGSRLTKSKQNTVDVRKELWISQVGKKGCKMESDALPSTAPKPINGCKVQGNLPMRTRGGDEHEPTTVPCSSKKVGRVGYGSIGKDLTERTCTRRSCSSFSSSGGERDDGWEAVADALPSLDNTKKQASESDPEPPLVSGSDIKCSNSIHRTEDCGKGQAQSHVGSPRAWAADDAFRPQSLPRVSTKQQPRQQHRKKLLMQNSSSSGGINRLHWQQAQTAVSEEPAACPICCEEFDVTDWSFLPCPCGFRLCLFCHNRILEIDARCPGCRKRYDSVHTSAGFESEPMVAHE